MKIVQEDCARRLCKKIVQEDCARRVEKNEQGIRRGENIAKN